MKWARIRFLFAGFLKVRILGWAIRSLQLVGAEQVGLEDCLQLRFFSLLGRRKEILHIKRDSVIFEEVRLNGSWGVSEVKFLSSRITPGSALLDLGANAGLISRQIQLVCPTPHFSILVEPIPINQEFITRNLVNFNYELLPFALGAISGKQKFFVRSSNIGNSSLKVENLNGDYTEMEVEVRDTSIIDQCLGRRQIGDLFLKSDLEGMDSQILARLSDNIWSRIQSGVIEVWPRVLDNHGDVDLLCAQLSKFKWMSWTPTGDSMLSIRELSDYWTRPSNPMATLYFSRF